MRESVARLRRAVARGEDLAVALDREDLAVTVPAAVELGWEGEAELRGAGTTLQRFLDDPAVTDVLVNGESGVWVDRGRGLEHHGTLGDAALGGGSGGGGSGGGGSAGEGDAQVRALAVRLAAAAGQRLDDACPVVDGTLPGGTRLHVVLPPLAPEGPLISLRTHRRRTLTLEDMVRSATVPAALAPVLRALVERRCNVLVSGSTGSGKTTMLAALLSLVPHDERIVCIEESAELQPDHPHVVHLQMRRANVQRVGEVGLTDLVRAALRMRPDRVVLGECRGAEVREVLSALNTGHEGGWATVHANAAEDVPARLAALGALAGMDRAAVAAQAVSAVDTVLHLTREHGRRRVAHLALLAEDFTCRRVLDVDAAGGVHVGEQWQVLAARLGLDPAVVTAPAPVVLPGGGVGTGGRGIPSGRGPTGAGR